MPDLRKTTAIERVRFRRKPGGGPTVNRDAEVAGFAKDGDPTYPGKAKKRYSGDMVRGTPEGEDISDTAMMKKYGGDGSPDTAKRKLVRSTETGLKYEGSDEPEDDEAADREYAVQARLEPQYKGPNRRKKNRRKGK